MSVDVKEEPLETWCEIPDYEAMSSAEETNNMEFSISSEDVKVELVEMNWAEGSDCERSTVQKESLHTQRPLNHTATEDTLTLNSSSDEDGCQASDYSPRSLDRLLDRMQGYTTHHFLRQVEVEQVMEDSEEIAGKSTFDTTSRNFDTAGGREISPEDMFCVDSQTSLDHTNSQFAELQARDRSWTTRVDGIVEPKFLQNIAPTKEYEPSSIPVQYFDDVFPEDMFDSMVASINAIAVAKRSKAWNDTSVPEMKAFLAIVVLMGLNPLPDIELYWSSDPFYNNLEVSGTMTCKRFKKLLEIHAADVAASNANYDKMVRVRPMVDKLNCSFQDNAINSQTQTIDESPLKFKGQDAKRYMKNHVKKGFTAWCRCDSTTGYLYHCDLVYKEKDKPNDKGFGYNIVEKLSQNLPRDTLLVFDSFFSSLPLLEALYHRQIYAIATVGISDLPKDLTVQDSVVKPGEFIYRVCPPTAIVKWRDTTDVYVMTTAVSPKRTEIIQRTQKDGQKKDMVCPSAIAEYMRHMGGVNRFDHFRSTYAIGGSSNTSWFTILWFLFESALINSYILYKHQNPSRQNDQRDFRLRLARSLKTEYISMKKQEPCVFKNKKGGVFGVPVEIRLGRKGHHFMKLSTSKRCRFCSTRKLEKRSKYECEICKVALCVVPCMKLYHQDYSEE